ncbi:hypothetical protein BX589_12054 [Paraburkholderia fungorum]|jgi:hypothetical protein|uniref:hypothetical protein n=1 Tax=Paraburkholderia fungorum TaxID=134537 RepID=UPI000D07AF1B|nr:hypothetical protein [Paraburkholderia fungorum]PRZ51213.1 hypothetical protein BX589_12054 [Paraburkholderia fungorum]
MSLKEKFQQIKAAIAQAINFADPAEVLQKAEHEFMEASAEAYHALEDRVVELETQLKSLIDPTAKAEEPPASDPPVEAGNAVPPVAGGITSDAATGINANAAGDAGNGDSAVQSATDGSATATSSDAESSTQTTPASPSAATPGVDAASTATA